MSLSLKKIKYHFFLSGNRQGMAIIMVLSSIVFVVLLAQETIFNTQIEHRSAAAELHSLRAYYAAKAGMEVSILRIKVYLNLTKQGASNSGLLQSLRPQLDIIWKFPFHWPPIGSKQSGSNDGEGTTRSLTNTSFMQNSSYLTSITPANSLLDINDIASPIPSLRNWTLQVLQRLIAQLRENNNTLADEVSEADINDILLNIQDWVDPNTQVGEESTQGETLRYKNKSLPPNRSLASLEELNQVAGMTDILYHDLKPFITVHGEKGINVSTVSSPQLIQALHPDIPWKIAEQIAQQNSELMNTVVFTKDSFLKFLEEQGLRAASYDLNNSKEQTDNTSYLTDNAPYNFHIISTGLSGLAEKTITATYVDTNTLSKHFYNLMAAELEKEKRNSENDTPSKSSRGQEASLKAERNGENGENKTENQESEDEEIPQKPSIIYWKESS